MTCIQMLFLCNRCWYFLQCPT